jgi:hypothetical protein
MPGAVDLRLELRDVTPAVWRVLRVPSDLRLDDLHHAIQSVMGWDDFHPHVFEVGDEEYGPQLGTGDDDDEEEALHEDITRAGEDSELTVAKAFAKSPAGVTYIYNFVEDWRVHITIERAASDERADAVVCVAGDNAGPQQESRADEPFSVDAANRRLARSLRRRATPEFPAGPRATSDQQLLANLSLVVLMLGSRPTRHGTREAWKNVRTEVLESLQEAGLVDASPQRKSVTLTDAGVAHAQRLLDKLRAL